MLNWNQRDYLANLVHREIGRRQRTLAKAQRHDGQSQDEFDEVVSTLREKLVFQQALVAALEDDDSWPDV